MDKHRCKLCLRSFANGRALGGHMRSHMMNLYVPPKAEGQQPPPPPPNDGGQLGDETESASSSSSEEEEEEENEEKGLLGYGLRENPKKSIRMVDPVFSFAADAGSVILQDRESETESSKNPIRRRSKRIRKSGISEHHHHYHDQNLKEPEMKKPKSGKFGKPESSWPEPEPVSSISDTTPDEDVAYCLMMLSRDKWMRNEEDEEPEPEDDQTEESDQVKYSKARVRGKYKCETCHKVFRSYQALGGHRASHKKARIHNTAISKREPSEAETRNTSTSEEKIHECPVCYRVFSSGQALGGHKRSHVTGSATTILAAKPPSKFGETLIDLNLPAPIDDDDISQIELSAVSDAEFVNPIKQMNH